jgi:hypothetical protein
MSSGIEQPTEPTRVLLMLKESRAETFVHFTFRFLPLLCANKGNAALVLVVKTFPRNLFSLSFEKKLKQQRASKVARYMLVD